VLDAVPEADDARVGRAVADERLEQGRLARAVRPHEATCSPRSITSEAPSRSGLPPAASRSPSISTTVRPVRAGFRNSEPTVRRRCVRFSSSLAACFRSFSSARSASASPAPVSPCSSWPGTAPRSGSGARCPLPRVAPTSPPPARARRARAATGARGLRSRAASALELEHGRRHRLEEPAVVGDEHDGGVDRRQLALEPLEALDVEVVRRLVEQQQVGVARQRAASEARVSSPPRRSRAVGRGRGRGSRARAAPTRRGRASSSRPRARAAPAPRCSAAASPRRAPAAIACSSSRSSCSMRTRSAAPESAYSRSVSPWSRGGRWSCSATRVPFWSATSPPGARSPDDRAQQRRLAGAFWPPGEPLPRSTENESPSKRGSRRTPCGDWTRSGRTRD